MGNRPDRGSVSENMRSAAAVLFYLGIQTCLHAAVSQILLKPVRCSIRGD
jgi:hypothetical protein